MKKKQAAYELDRGHTIMDWIHCKQQWDWWMRSFLGEEWSTMQPNLEEWLKIRLDETLLFLYSDSCFTAIGYTFIFHGHIFVDIYVLALLNFLPRLLYHHLVLKSNQWISVTYMICVLVNSVFCCDGFAEILFDAIIYFIMYIFSEFSRSFARSCNYLLLCH